jgi:crossover junction endodeoxyribonuclease RuvC
VRILGIDPGLVATGYGVVESRDGTLRLIEGGSITPGRSKKIEERLAELQRNLSQIIESLHPEAMAVEEVFSRTAYPRTAILMAHARGSLIAAAAIAGVPVFHYSATAVRRSLLGNGAASKQQVAHMVAHMLHLRPSLGPADATDALALALTHCHRRKFIQSRGSREFIRDTQSPCSSREFIRDHRARKR